MNSYTALTTRKKEIWDEMQVIDDVLKTQPNPDILRKFKILEQEYIKIHNETKALEADGEKG